MAKLSSQPSFEIQPDIEISQFDKPPIKKKMNINLIIPKRIIKSWRRSRRLLHKASSSVILNSTQNSMQKVIKI